MLPDPKLAPTVKNFADSEVIELKLFTYALKATFCQAAALIGVWCAVQEEAETRLTASEVIESEYELNTSSETVFAI